MLHAVLATFLTRIDLWVQAGKLFKRLFTIKEGWNWISSYYQGPGKSNPSSDENSFRPVICITINAQSRRYCIQIDPSMSFYWWLWQAPGSYCSIAVKLQSSNLQAALEEAWSVCVSVGETWIDSLLLLLQYVLLMCNQVKSTFSSCYGFLVLRCFAPLRSKHDLKKKRKKRLS